MSNAGLWLGLQSLPRDRTHFPRLWTDDLLYKHPSNSMFSKRKSDSGNSIAPVYRTYLARLSTITIRNPVTFLLIALSSLGIHILARGALLLQETSVCGYREQRSSFWEPHSLQEARWSFWGLVPPPWETKAMLLLADLSTPGTLTAVPKTIG